MKLEGVLQSIWMSNANEENAKKKKCTSWAARVNHKVLPQQGPTQFRLSAHPVTRYTRKVFFQFSNSFALWLFQSTAGAQCYQSQPFQWLTSMYSSDILCLQSSFRFPHIYWPQLFFSSGKWHWSEILMYSEDRQWCNTSTILAKKRGHTWSRARMCGTV